MTDKEVQRLGRRELLEFLLEAREENDALLRERDELRSLRDALQQERDGLLAEVQKLRSDPGTPKYSPEDVNERAAVLLQEARAAADNVMESRRAQQEAKEQHLQEWERRLQDRDALLSEKERRAREDRISQEAQIQRVLSDARREATQTPQSAEAEAARTLKRAAEQASQIELRAEQDAELLLQHAQEDSNSFWQDVTELLQKRILDQNSD